MNPFLDKTSCAMCRECYRSNSLQCKDACRRCSVAMFSDDSVNIYPFSGSFQNSVSQSPFSASSWPYPQNYPFGYPAHTPTPKSYGRIYYNYPRVSNQYYPAMLPYNNFYRSSYR